MIRVDEALSAERDDQGQQRGLRILTQAIARWRPETVLDVMTDDLFTVDNSATFGSMVVDYG